MIARRSANDEQWQAVKKQVKQRDGSVCRLLKILSAKDALRLQRNAGALIKRLDAAHIYPVSQYIPMTYEVNNIVQLNRWSHTMLDSSKDPVTGDFINKETVMKWWEKIAGEQQWKSLQNVKEYLDANKFANIQNS